MNKTRTWVLIALLASILTISKEILVFLPNIEIVSFLLIVYTHSLPTSMVYMIALIFCFIQIMLYGIGLWTPMYFILWPLLILLTKLLKNNLKTESQLAVFNALFGLCFGFMTSIPYFIIDFKMGWAGFLRGIPFDLIHCIGNYLVMLVLYQPSMKVINTLLKRYSY